MAFPILWIMGNPCYVLTYALDYDLVVSGFEPHSCYYVHCYPLNFINVLSMCSIAPLLLYNKLEFRIDTHTNVEIPLNKEIIKKTSSVR